MWTLMTRRWRGGHQETTGGPGRPVPAPWPPRWPGPTCPRRSGDRGPSGRRRAGQGTVVGPQCPKPGTGKPHWALGPERPLGSPGAARGHAGGLVGTEVKRLRERADSGESWLRTASPRRALGLGFPVCKVGRHSPCVANVRIKEAGAGRAAPASLTCQAVGTRVPLLLPQAPQPSVPGIAATAG